jgi:hypothetical protein
LNKNAILRPFLEWNEFEDHFTPSSTRTDLEPEWYKILKHSVLLCDKAMKDERGEQEQLI